MIKVAAGVFRVNETEESWHDGLMNLRKWPKKGMILCKKYTDIDIQKDCLLDNSAAEELLDAGVGVESLRVLDLYDTRITSLPNSLLKLATLKVFKEHTRKVYKYQVRFLVDQSVCLGLFVLSSKQGSKRECGDGGACKLRRWLLGDVIEVLEVLGCLKIGCLHDVNIDRDGIDRGCVSSFTLEMQVMLHNEIKQKFPCKKVQTVVATSTTEAEYVAAASCCGQVLWIQNQLLDYGYNFMNTMIHIDNNSTICIIENHVQHSKTKHIEIRHHFIRDYNAKKLIQMVKIDTEHNVADLLTKGFDAGRFQYLVSIKNEWKDLLHQKKSVKHRVKSKEVGTLRYLSLVVPLKKVSDEAVHKELGDIIERAATTASSLEAD
ncbi:hypothetical protein Tco_1411001 [Tanacetum coccineum]